jgi:hypothetical protein
MGLSQVRVPQDRTRWHAIYDTSSEDPVATKTGVEMDMKPHEFLISALNGGDWSASRFCLFIVGNGMYFRVILVINQLNAKILVL